MNQDFHITFQIFSLMHFIFFFLSLSVGDIHKKTPENVNVKLLHSLCKCHLTVYRCLVKVGKSKSSRLVLSKYQDGTFATQTFCTFYCTVSAKVSWPPGLLIKPPGSSVIPFEAFSTALNHKPFSFFQTWNPFLTLQKSKSGRVCFCRF